VRPLRSSINGTPLLGLTIAVGTMAAVNVVLLAVAASDRSWVAMGIGILYGPAANLVVATALLAVSPLLPWWPSRSMASRVLILGGLAALGAVVDFAVVSSMSLHGC